jgi:hypothetical protein
MALYRFSALKNPRKRRLCAALVITALAGCGGGGGGGGVVPPPPTVAPTPAPAPAAGGSGNNQTGGDGGGAVPPASVSYPTMTTLNGQARVYTAIMSNGGNDPTRGQVSARADGRGNFTFTVNALNPEHPPYAFTVGPTASGLHSLPGTSCGNCFRTDTINTAGIDGTDSTRVFGAITYLDINGMGLSYLSVGTWAVQNNRIDGAVSGGAGVVGIPTRDADIPKTGRATYNGQFIGRYMNGLEFSIIGATASSVADFGSGVVTLNTTNSQRQDTTAMPQLDFSGSMNFLTARGARTNQLQGPMATRGGLVGDAHGSFYGPAAAELGGAVVFKGPAGTNEAFIGGFGMKKQ